MTPSILPPLYPIVDIHDSAPSESARALSLACALAGAGIRLIQLRAKTLEAGRFADIASQLVRSLGDLGAALIINDRVDIALVTGAAGAHLGDEDLSVADARRVLPDRALIGFSTHAFEDLETPAAKDADYLGFGPIFPSPTKPHARIPRGVELLARVCRQTDRPVAAIGGVTLETAPELWAAGAAAVAVISELEKADDPAALARKYLRAAERVIADRETQAP